MARGLDTDIGGRNRAFPPTRWTVVREAGIASSPAGRRALEELCTLYWKPVYACIRATRGAGVEEAKDLTQGFFCELIEGGLLARFSPGRGTFRAYLRGAVDLFVRERHREASALKRGGGRGPLSLDDDAVRGWEEFAARREIPTEQVFDRAWAAAVLDRAVADLRDELQGCGKEAWFRAFDRYDLNPPPEGPPTYASLAAELGVKESDVGNYLSACRRRLRDLVREQVRDYVSEEPEVLTELAALFG